MCWGLGAGIGVFVGLGGRKGKSLKADLSSVVKYRNLISSSNFKHHGR